MRGDLWPEMIGRVLLIVIGLIILSFPPLFILAWRESLAWQKFAADHHCVASDARSKVRLMPMGKIVMPQPYTETGYSCDDGKVYWR